MECRHGDRTKDDMTGKTSRTILLLQGPPSLFWAELAAGFEAAGHRVLKVNLCVGDWIFWRRKGAVNYRGRFKKWRPWLTSFVAREGVTDILYYADQLPYHVVAREVANAAGIPAYAVEFGYLRPDWLTLERGGMGAYSHFPDDPDLIRRAAANLPDPPAQSGFSYRFNQEAFGEVTFHLSTELLRPFYPFYKHDTYYHPFVDYISWILRLLKVKGALAHATAVCRKIYEQRTPFFLLALQLQSDYQIRANSPYRHLGEMLEEVIGSFAHDAPPGDHLVIKIHPLDNGYENWPKLVAEIADRHGVSDRIHAIDGGLLAQLIDRAKGVVVVNSTVGLHAIRAGCPTKVLGVAVFDIAGLTDQGTLTEFWREPAPVDPYLSEAMVRLMAASIQIRGSFYNPAGRAAAVPEIVRRIENGLVNEPGAYVPIPPRLARAKAIGVPIAEAAMPAAE